MRKQGDRCGHVGRNKELTCTRLAGHESADVEKTGYVHHEYRTEEASERYKAACRQGSQRYRDQVIRPRKQLVAEYKTARGCEACGYNQHPVALDLDHVDRSTKLAALSVMVLDPGKYPLHALVAELDKCRVLCRNCHAIKTYENKDFLRL